MFRSVSILGAAALAALAATAHAEPARPLKLSDFPAGTFIGEGRVMVVTPPEQFNSSPPFEVSNVLWLNRCKDDCMVMGGTINDARQHISTYITPGPHIVTEYKNVNGEKGALADAEWNAVVQCIKEIYSPFNIVVTDQKPTGTGNYTEAIIAGDSADVGLSAQILGVAPAHTSCEPNDNAMSYTFANNAYFFGDAQRRIWELCSTAGQESAHHFGLDHAYEFFDKTSACNDPMTYRTDCGGQKFFRNKRAKCGEMAARACKCGSTQNSHQQLISIFGEGMPITPPPHASLVFPVDNTPVLTGWVAHVSAGSARGVAKVELYLNGSRWGVLPGGKFGANGQGDQTYTFYPPANVPDGIIEVSAIAYDDLGLSVQTQTVTVTKGTPCTTDDACLDNQRCDAGRCVYPAPDGELGDSCGYDQACKSWTCIGGDGDQRCSQECATDEPTSCPDGFSCLGTGQGTAGYCLTTDEGGCCSVGRGAGAPWVHGGIALVVFGLVRRRRAR